MGIKGKKKRRQPPQPPKYQGSSEVRTGPVSAASSDCSNSFRLEAESVLQHKDGELQDKSTSPPQHKDGLLRQKHTNPQSSLQKSFTSALVARDGDNTVETEFLDFLRKFRLAPSESPYYKGELKAMVERNSLTLCVYYQHVAKHDEKLGNSLCRYFIRVGPMLNSALRSFIIEQDLKDKCKKISSSCPTVTIYGLPPPGSIQALDDFLGEKNNKVVKRVQIHGNESIISDTTELGRNLFIGLLEYIFPEHQKGLSWNGTFTMNDLQVKDRIRFEIAIKASAQATRQAMANDMNQLADLLFKFYKSEGCLPAYFDDLRTSMKGCFQEIQSFNSHKTISFRKYLLSHLALKSAMARGHLFLDLYRVRKAIGKDDYKDLTDFLGSISFHTNWSNLVGKHPMLEKVYKFGNKEDDGTLKRKPYKNNLDCVLIFIRHAAQHGPDNTKDNDHEQTLKSLIENDLIISNHLEFYILKLIKTLLDKYKMKDDIFLDVWSHFSKSK